MPPEIFVIDGKTFFIRGHLPIRVLDDPQPFGLGLWATVSRESFDRYVELWDQDASAEPRMHGHLSADFKSVYRGACLLNLEIHLQSRRVIRRRSRCRRAVRDRAICASRP